MKIRIGPLLGLGLGYLMGSGKAKPLIDKAKSALTGADRAEPSFDVMTPSGYAPPVVVPAAAEASSGADAFS